MNAYWLESADKYGRYTDNQFGSSFIYWKGQELFVAEEQYQWYKEELRIRAIEVTASALGTSFKQENNMNFTIHRDSHNSVLVQKGQQLLLYLKMWALKYYLNRPLSRKPSLIKQ